MILDELLLDFRLLPEKRRDDNSLSRNSANNLVFLGSMFQKKTSSPSGRRDNPWKRFLTSFKVDFKRWWKCSCMKELILARFPLARKS